MGREIRLVPKNWEHPKNDRGHIPLYGYSYSVQVKEWDAGKEQWDRGFYKSYNGWNEINEGVKSSSFEEWTGERPLKEDYMPDWSKDEMTHYQMYETVTEGTPISPVMGTLESLAHWLTDNKANAGAGGTASYESWLEICTGGWSPTFTMRGGVLQNGVEGFCKMENSDN